MRHRDIPVPHFFAQAVSRSYRNRLTVQFPEGHFDCTKRGFAMTRIILDATLASKLHDLGQVAELCDPAGRVVGKFIPLIDLSKWKPLSPDVSEEELDRIEQSNEKCYSTAEVLEHLRNLGKQ
jgi:hypothetical protein